MAEISSLKVEMKEFKLLLAESEREVLRLIEEFKSSVIAELRAEKKPVVMGDVSSYQLESRRATLFLSTHRAPTSHRFSTVQMKRRQQHFVMQTRLVSRKRKSSCTGHRVKTKGSVLNIDSRLIRFSKSAALSSRNNHLLQSQAANGMETIAPLSSQRLNDLQYRERFKIGRCLLDGLST